MPSRTSRTYQISVRFPINIYEKLQLKAESTEVTISDYIRAIIQKELQEQDRIQERYGYDPAKRVFEE